LAKLEVVPGLSVAVEHTHSERLCFGGTEVVSFSSSHNVSFFFPLIHHGFNSRLQLLVHSHINIKHISILSPSQ
jgi:hypothetical protein